MSLDRGVVYIHNGILLSHKKNEIMPSAATCIDLEMIRLSEGSQTEKDKYCMISLMWNLKYDTNKLISKMDSHRKQTYVFQRKSVLNIHLWKDRC